MVKIYTSGGVLWLRVNLIGMLLHGNATYMQVLEGSDEDVYHAYNSILKDSRNYGHVTVVTEGINKRNFLNWSIGFERLESYLAH